MTRSNQSSDFVNPTMRAALQAGFFGSAMLVLYALTQDWWRGSAIAFAVGTLASLGAGAIGGGAGFLFALPRFGSTAAMQEFDEETRQSVKDDTVSAVFTPSDNLVQISDWLTKLLIGAGLVQLGNIGRTLGQLIGQIAGGLTDTSSDTAPASARVIAGSILVYYALLSFLFFYGNISLSYRRLLQQWG